MWGIIPAAGRGSRIQPLAFSKELLPVGSRLDGSQTRPRAVSEYLLERMSVCGIQRVCFVIAPGKSDILDYYGGSAYAAKLCYTVQPQPLGLCDAVFCALPFIPRDDYVVVGLPDTVWFPQDGLTHLPRDTLGFLLFPVAQPQLFDVVLLHPDNSVCEIQVKPAAPASNWVWGAFGMPAMVLHDLCALWCRRGREDVYFGTLINAYIANGGRACGIRAGTSYIDVGTVDGYREALQLLLHETVPR